MNATKNGFSIHSLCFEIRVYLNKMRYVRITNIIAQVQLIFHRMDGWMTECYIDFINAISAFLMGMDQLLCENSEEVYRANSADCSNFKF